MNKIRAIPLAAQLAMLKKHFPSSTSHMKSHEHFIWKTKLQPTALSEVYEIKIDYRMGSNPNVYVTSPKPLRLAEGHKKLPHVYNHDKQHLCIYHKKMNEWNAGKAIVNTILPWVSEWLFHYEIWVSSGEWRGGGIH